MSCKDDLGNKCGYIIKIALYSIASPNVKIADAVKIAQRIYGSKGICIKVIAKNKLKLSAKQAVTLRSVDGLCKCNIKGSDSSII